MKSNILLWFLVLTLPVSFFFTACSKDRIIEAYDLVLQAAGDWALTRDGRLQGERDFGEDSYVGAYQADYEDFDGLETLFGGTGLDRAAGDRVSLRGRLTVRTGEARLLFRCGAEEEVLAEGSGEFSFNLRLQPGGNYLCLRGEGFSGSLELELE